MCNLKSNKNLKEILEYKKALKDLPLHHLEFVLFPSTLYLPFFYDASYKVGSQNMSTSLNKPLTGEILAHQLTSLNVKYVLLNHSEAHENSEDILLKIKNATKNHLKVVLCIGEEKEASKEDVLKEIIPRLFSFLNALNEEERKNIIVAYEPLWAINNQNINSIENINEIIKELKQEIKKVFTLDSEIVYGGGINETNFLELSKCDNIDGFLLGNYAINPENIWKIIKML